MNVTAKEVPDIPRAISTEQRKRTRQMMIAKNKGKDFAYEN